MTYAFVIPGEPVPKARPRVGRSGHAYTPERTRKAEQRVAFIAKAAAIGGPLSGALHVELEFALGTRRRVDWDNLSKLVCDACNGVLWADDAQIELALVRKRLGVGRDAALTRVRVETLDAAP